MPNPRLSRRNGPGGGLMEDLTPRGSPDLVVTGRLVTPEDVRPGAVVVAGGRITAIARIEDAPPGVPRLDARDGYVIPGLIDSDVHFRTPGLEEDWAYGSRAAVAGGVTTVLDMPGPVPPVRDPDAIRARAAMVAGSSLVDYAFHLGADPWRPELLADLDPAIAVSAVAASPADPETLDRIFAVAAARDVQLTLHAEDGRPPGHSQRRGADLVVSVIELVRRYGTRAHLLRLSGREEIDQVAEAEADGLPVTFGLTGHQLSFCDTDTRRPPAGRERLWAALRSGEVTCLGSDHSGTAFGVPGVQELATTVWTGMRRRWPGEDADVAMRRLVDRLATRPAALYRLPGKGRLEPGADADLVIFHPDEPWTFSARDAHAKSGRSAYEGRTMAGRVLTTIRRGDIVWNAATRTFGAPNGRWVRPAPARSPSAAVPRAAREPDERRGVDSGTFRRAMACLAAPLTVLTCYDSGRRMWGLTVSAVSSLSMDPPLILICLDKGGRSHDIIADAEALCLHVLSPGQEDLAVRFAAREERFRDVRVLPGRAPELVDVPVRIMCTPYDVRDGGDHTILLGLVEDATIAGHAGGGLVWHHRAPAGAVPLMPVGGPAAPGSHIGNIHAPTRDGLSGA